MWNVRDDTLACQLCFSDISNLDTAGRVAHYDEHFVAEAGNFNRFMRLDNYI
jgi:hypothetical protein